MSCVDTKKVVGLMEQLVLEFRKHENKSCKGKCKSAPHLLEDESHSTPCTIESCTEDTETEELVELPVSSIPSYPSGINMQIAVAEFLTEQSCPNDLTIEDGQKLTNFGRDTDCEDCLKCWFDAVKEYI